MPAILEVGNSYNFETYAPALLGTSYQGVLVLAIYDYNRAIKDRDVTATHHQIYSALPAGTPDDPASTYYAMLKLPSGDFTVLGLTWIKEETVVRTEAGTISVEVPGVTADDVVNIRDQLALAGYDNVKITYTPLAYAEL